jgi:hypothetical protein
MERVVRGQKFIVYACLVYLVAIVLQIALGPAAGLISLIALPLALIGLVRLCGGLGYSLLVKILLVILMFVPIVNLVTLLILNSRATSSLRAAGYTVGLLGARNAPVA